MISKVQHRLYFLLYATAVLIALFGLRFICGQEFSPLPVYSLFQNQTRVIDMKWRKME
nr:MAG TPA: hypothetical protein [Bacteriophage sp.]